MIEEIKIDENTSIYKTKYNWEYSKENFIKRIYQSIKMNNHYQLKNLNGKGKGLYFANNYVTSFSCREYDSINNFILKTISYEILKTEYNEWAVENFIYINTGKNPKNEEELEKMKEYEWHRHPVVYYDNDDIKTDFVFTFYIQMPDNLTEDEGKIAFRTDNSNGLSFLPDAGDIFIFPDIDHSTCRLLSEKNKDRLLIAGNISLNPLAKIMNKKLV
jgi:hypothetical protein